MPPSQDSLPMCGWQDQLKLGLLGFFGQDFSKQEALPQLEMVAFLKGLPEIRWISQFQWALALGPVLYPCNHETQDRSAHWTWCQSSVVMQATCGLLPTGSRMCRLQLYASIGLPGLQGWPPAWCALLLQWLGGGCPRYQAHIWAKTSSIRHLH